MQKSMIEATFKLEPILSLCNGSFFLQIGTCLETFTPNTC